MNQKGISTILGIIIGLLILSSLVIGGMYIFRKSGQEVIQEEAPQTETFPIDPLANMENFSAYKDTKEYFQIYGDACDTGDQPEIDAANQLVNSQPKKVLVINEHLRLLLTSSIGYPEVEEICRSVVVTFVKPYPSVPGPVNWENILWLIGSCPRPAALNKKCVDDEIEITKRFNLGY